MTPLFKKLNLVVHSTILVLNAPDSFESELLLLEDRSILRKATSKTRAPFLIGFAVTQKELATVSNKMAKAAEGDAILWVAYPKGTSKNYSCEFNRDTDWEILGAAGFEPVRQVAIDEDWSALRFRRAEFIKSLTRNNAMAISEEGKLRTNR